jgi:two-component system, sensor histidine kinase LadS
MRKLAAVSWLFMMAFVSIGQPLLIEKSLRYDPRDFIFHIRDTTNDVTIEQISRADNWKKDRSINYGFDRVAHWFYIDVRSDSIQDLLLEIAFAPLDRIDFYYPSGKLWLHKTSGDLFPISNRDISYQHPVFKFSLQTDAVQRIYLRIQTSSSLQIPITIWQPEAFSNRAIHLQIFNGIFYGAMMVMILYQIFLFVSTRDRVSLYYIFTLLAMIHVVSFFQGYSFLYAYPEWPSFNKFMAILTGPVFLFFSTWLTRAFLELKKHQPLIDNLLLINVAINIIISIVMLLDLTFISYQVHHYAILVHAVLALIGASLAIYNRFRPALFYLLSWLTLLLAAVIFSVSNLGFMGEYINTTSSALIFACLLQMLFISFALGNRWNVLVKENVRARELELKRQEAEKGMLEREVKLRTEEIQQQNEKLEEVNRIKDKLFSVVSHDIKGPLTSLQLALALTKTDTITQQEFRDLTTSLEGRFKQTTEFIENLLQWAKLQLKGETFEPSVINIRQLIGNTVHLLEPEIFQKGIKVSALADESLKAFADPNMIRSVLKNLLTNAVKFTGKDGVIEVRGKQDRDSILISVSDTGMGIPPVNRDKVFSLDIVTTPGTRQEKGTGLGLILCKEFVERNSGKIWFESEEGKGTTFYFSIPSSANQ